MELKIDQYTLRSVGTGDGWKAYSLWENFDKPLGQRGPDYVVHGYYVPKMDEAPRGMRPGDHRAKVARENDEIAIRKAHEWIAESRKQRGE